MEDFHRIIQTTMGWTNSHLHEFVSGRMRLAPGEFEVEGARDYGEILLPKLFLILTCMRI